METGNFKVQIANVHSPDFAYLYQEFNKMAQKLELLIEKDYTQKLLLQKAELKQLQAQINSAFSIQQLFYASTDDPKPKISRTPKVSPTHSEFISGI